jgi:hypothetical protein
MDAQDNNADGVGAFGDNEELTPVAVPRKFLVGSLGRTADSLYRAGDVGLEARRLVTAGAGKAALRALKEELTDLREILAGVIRALDRVEIEDP